MLDKGPSAGDASLKARVLQVFTWRPSVPWQGPHSALMSSQVTSHSPVPSEPGAQGPKSTQLTLQSHSSESTRGSPRSQRSPYSGPLSLSLMPNLARLHGRSHSCDALPCFSPGANYTSAQGHCVTWVFSGHPSQGHAHPTHLLPSACTEILTVMCSFPCLSVCFLTPPLEESSKQAMSSPPL